MSFDYWVEKGVVYVIEDMVKLIDASNKSEIAAICRSHALEVAGDEAGTQDGAKSPRNIFGHLAELKVIPTIQELRDALVRCVEVEDQAPTHWCYYYIQCQESLFELWKSILEQLSGQEKYRDLPELVSIELFKSNEHAASDVPVNVACFVFDSDQCFEKTLTDCGKALKRAFGTCLESTWHESG